MKDYESNKKLLFSRFNKLLFTKKDVAGILGVSLSTINNFIQMEIDDFPKPIKIGDNNSKGTIRFSIDDIARYVSRC